MSAEQVYDNQGLCQLREMLRSCKGSLDHIEQLLVTTHEKLSQLSAKEISDCNSQNPQIVIDIVTSYQQLIKQIDRQKKEALQEIQQVQKSASIVHSYVQREESASFIDLDL